MRKAPVKIFSGLASLGNDLKLRGQDHFHNVPVLINSGNILQMRVFIELGLGKVRLNL